MSVDFEDDRVLVFCHAGCSNDELLQCLTIREVWPYNGTPIPYDMKDRAKRIKSAPAGWGRLSGRSVKRPFTSGPYRVIDAIYTYVDEGGQSLFQVVRYRPKDFRQRRPDGNGGWIWNTIGVRRVLYRLPQVLQAISAGQTIYVVEGEKDVHALEAAGCVATCNPGGAAKWLPEHTEFLRAAAKVVVVADKDSVGLGHAQAIAEALNE